MTDDQLGDAWTDLNVPHLGHMEQINSIVKDKHVRRVYIAMPMAESASVKPLATSLVEANVDVIWAPDIFGVSLLNHAVKEIAGVPLISLSETPLVGGSALAKTLLDKSFAFLALTIFSPLMLLVRFVGQVNLKRPCLV
jgi:putative colanic acid biosynthesis UDP-glucose lipid carrier transferase